MINAQIPCDFGRTKPTLRSAYMDLRFTVVSAIWAILGEQNRGPFIRNAVLFHNLAKQQVRKSGIFNIW